MGFDFDKAKSDLSTAIDYNTWLMAHSEPEQGKTSRFMTLSATIHAAAILIMAMITVPLIEEVKTETITIEIEEPAPILKAARGARVLPTSGGTPAMTETPVVEKLADAGSPGDVVIAKSAPAKALKSTKTATAKTPRAKSASIAAKTDFKAVPMTIDDIDAPELDQGDLASATVASPMTEDFNEDLAKLDNNHRNTLDNEKSTLDKMAAALADEQDENLNAIDDLNRQEATKLAALQDSIRRKNAENMASALASERAAALAEAARDAATKKAGLGGNGNGFGTKQGHGAGNSGSTEPGTQLAGLPTGVRSLDQLRQMPGNPRPHYDREERRKGHQGEIAFVAYISKEGFPTKFRMLKSTGFRNLDSKTLGSLKKWRFYPGQEGWVELPFRWDLKGGVQEDGGTLRRSVSRR